MAQFLNQKKPKRIKAVAKSGFNAMGKPIPFERKAVADEHLKDMGIKNIEDRYKCIEMVSHRLRHGQIHEAIGDAMKYVDLTGAYRLLAVLLSA